MSKEKAPERAKPLNKAVVRSADTVDPSIVRSISAPRPLTDLHPLYAINERCLDLLVQAARTSAPGTFSLVSDLRDLLGHLTPEARARAAQRALLLVDMHFADGRWWRTVQENPLRPAPLSAWQGTFARGGGIQLAYAALLLAWHTAHAAPDQVSLLGMTTEVSDTIAELPITVLDQLAKRHYKHLRPRWEDRPAVWRRLLASAQTEDIRRARDFALYGIQLLTAELISPVRRSTNSS
jgi:hypothetical protein